MDDYILNVGANLKLLRKDRNLTLSKVAHKAGVTAGLLSKIENGRTIPSLPVLFNLINALDITLKEYFDRLPSSQSQKFFVFKQGTQTSISKEDEAKGFNYFRIFGKQLPTNSFEFALLELEPNAKRGHVTTDAFELKHILEGSCDYLIEDEVITLEQGDTLFFDGRTPHVPRNNATTLCKMLIVYFYY